MSKSTRNLVIAAAAASLFLAGCATQGDASNGTSAQGSAFTTGNSCGKANKCKGMSKCKGMVSKAKKHHKAKAKKEEVNSAAPANGSENTSAQ